MSSFFDEIARNRMKSILLMCLFSALFFAFIYLFVLLLGGGIFGLILGGILVIGYAFVAYYSGSRIVLKISGAKPASEKDYPQLYNIVEGLAAAAQIPQPQIYVINDPSPNAFATGRNKKHASVAVTTGLLSMMSTDELEGVLAHEISHIYNNDIQFMMLAIVFGGVIGLLAAFLRYSFFFGMMGGEGRGGNGYIVLIGLLLSIIAPIVAILLRLAISRRREYMADANGARMTRDPQSLASALTKIKAYEDVPMKQRMQQRQQGANQAPAHQPNPVTSSMYFANPLSRHALSSLFSTHPPIEERIRRLQQMH